MNVYSLSKVSLSVVLLFRENPVVAAERKTEGPLLSSTATGTLDRLLETLQSFSPRKTRTGMFFTTPTAPGLRRQRDQ